jgi:prephenate dehydratase
MPYTKEVQVQYLLRRLGTARITCVGPEFSASHQAAIHKWGGEKNLDKSESNANLMEISCVSNATQALNEVLHGRATWASVPYSDAHTGGNQLTLDFLLDMCRRAGLGSKPLPLIVSGECRVNVDPVLVGNCTISQVTTIYVPFALSKRCEQKLQVDFGQIDQIEVSSSLAALNRVREESCKSAAVEEKITKFSLKPLNARQNLRNTTSKRQIFDRKWYRITKLDMDEISNFSLRIENRSSC